MSAFALIHPEMFKYEQGLPERNSQDLKRAYIWYGILGARLKAMAVATFSPLPTLCVLCECRYIWELFT